MKLTQDEAKSIVKKVHIDLGLYHDSNYPVLVAGIEKDADPNSFPHWVGGYDYSHPIGDDGWGKYEEYNIIIDDEKGEAILYGYYTGHFVIELDSEGKYTVVRQLGR